ncbi:MAG: hypothetical protein ABJM29_20015 [Rhizobiaceae bacterium]
MMKTVSSAVSVQQANDVPETASASELINAFKLADMQLRLAIEQEQEDQIGQFGDQVDQLVSDMLAFDTDTSSERPVLLRFLVDRFVLREDSSTELRRAVCEKLLRLA